VGTPTDTLWFTVLDAPVGSAAAGVGTAADATSWNGWYSWQFPEAAVTRTGNSRRAASRRPAEVRVAGMDLLTVTPDAVRVAPADADMQVVSDGRLLSVFRASTHGSTYLDRLVLRSVEEEVRGQTRRTFHLEHVSEVRYQRSGLRDVPASDTDGPSSVDLLGTPFAEPTVELPGVGAGGALAVARAPGGGSSSTWHVAWVEDGAVQHVAFTESATALVDLTGGLRRYAPVRPRLDGVPLVPVAGLAPALALYGELDATNAADGRPVELPRAGRLVLAVAVAGAGLTAATTVIDCALDSTGHTPDLPDAALDVVLVDGTLTGGVFHPDTTSPYFPTAEVAPLVARLVDGLEVTTMLLGQVQPHTSPVLRPGEDGLLHLYLGGPVPSASDDVPTWGRLLRGVPQAQVAQFDPRVTRAVLPLPWVYDARAEEPAGDVRLVSRLAGPLVVGSSVAVTPCTLGPDGQGDPQADLCTVTVEYAPATGWGGETWTGVPREVAAFLAVLGGGSDDDTAAPSVESGQVPFYDIDARRPLARLPLDALPTSATAEGGAASGEPFAPVLTLVTDRTTIPLVGVEVADAPPSGDGGPRRTLTARFRAPGGAPITVVWPEVPAAVDLWPAILEGSVDRSVYPDRHDTATTALLGLATDSYQVDAPVLLVPAGPQDDLRDVTLRVVPAAAGPTRGVGAAEIDDPPGTTAVPRVDVVLTRGDEQVELRSVRAEVAAFAAALSSDAAVRALGVAVDVTGAAGNVLPTDGTQGPLGLRSFGALLDVVMPSPVTPGLQVRVGVRAVGLLGRTRRATPPRGQDSSTARLFGFAVTADPPQAGVPAHVVDRAAAQPGLVNRTLDRTRLAARALAPGGPRSRHVHTAVPGLPASGVWLRHEPTLACTFDGASDVEVPVATDGKRRPAALDLAPAPAWTFETWLRPRGSERRRVVTFQDAVGSRPVDPDAPSSAYWVDVEGQEVLDFASFTKKPGHGDGTFLLAGISEHAHVLPAGAFTWEAWVQPRPDPVVAGTTYGILFAITDPDRGRVPLQVALDSTRRLAVGVATDDGRPVWHTSTVPLTAGTDEHRAWTHVAVVGEQVTGGRWRLALYVNATLDREIPDLALAAGDPLDRLSIGSAGPDDVTAVARLAALRLWGVARTPVEVRRTAFASLSGAEAGLLGSWPLSALRAGGPTGQVTPNVAALTGSAWDAALHRSTQPLALAKDDYFVSVVASVGGLPPVEAHTSLASGQWNHLALVYRAGGALDLNPPARYDAGAVEWAQVRAADGLGLLQRFACDAWVRVEATHRSPATIVSRWAWDEEPDQRSFAFGLDADGRLVLDAVLDTDDGTWPVSATGGDRRVADGVLHHVAFTIELVPSAEGAEEPVSTCVVTFFVDGEKVHEVTKTCESRTLEPHPAQVDLLLGRSACAPPDADQALESVGLLRGLLGRVRLWGTVPPLRDLFDERYRTAVRIGPLPGLLAQWYLDEGRGLVAEDSVGANDAALTTAEAWAGLRATSTLDVVANGARVVVVEPATGPVPTAPRPQFRLGRPDTSSPVEGLAGDLAQVMLWDRARSVSEIALQRFTPRSGDEPHLVAGWDFADGGTDITGGGNDARPTIPPARIAAADVPVTDEGAAVRHVYGGRITGLSESVPGRVAVGTGTLVDGAGTDEARASLVRYVVLDPQALTFPDPIDVGELDLVYIGQVQTRPTLIGYIEGAPPVPSENLSRPYYLAPTSPLYTAYAGASSITVKQEAARTLRYTSTSRGATDVSLSLGIGLFALESLTMSGFEIMGISTSVQTYNLRQQIQATLNAKTQVGSSEGTALAATWTSTQKDTVALQGEWEPHQSDPAAYLVPSIGRRFQPANLGYALVESLTADLYATVYRPTGASTGTIVVPNPAIPVDRNIVMFPMDDGYTKAGTLDGKVGAADDPSWPGADVRRGSYFRPVEAYGLAHRIEATDERLRAYADTFDATARGRRADKSLADAEKNLPVDFATSPQDAALVGTPRVGIVNRYVWHADRGLHVEENVTSASTTKTFGGWLEGGGGGGIKASGEFFFYLGFTYALDFSASHVVRVEVGEEEASTQSVSLDVQVPGESYLRAWSTTAPSEQGGTGTGAFLPGPAPGKVRAYRFMSMFVPPEVAASRGFRGIVDPTWRELSNDPAARALRELDASNPVWRVLHRVTYVERVPPKISTRPVLSTAGTGRPAVNVEGNAVLLQLVRARIDVPTPTPAQVGAAVAVVLDPPPDEGGGYPPSVLEEHVPWWRAFLDRARPSSAQPEPDEAAARLLRRLVTTAVDYVIASYRSTTR
jgi:hypothetical protein